MIENEKVMDLEKFSKRLKIIQKEKNWTLDDIGNIVGRSKGNVSGWINQKQAPSRKTDLMALARASGRTLSWLIGEDVEVNRGRKVPRYRVDLSEIKTDLMEFKAKNTPFEYVDISDDDTIEMFVIYSGGGMHPMILNGSEIGVSPIDNIRFGSISVVRLENGLYYTCYINYIDEQTVSLNHYNKDISEIKIKLNQIKNIYHVKKEIRTF